jgi:hypothetical protein
VRLREWDRRGLETVYGAAHNVGEVAMRNSKRREVTVGRAIVARLDYEMFCNREQEFMRKIEDAGMRDRHSGG